jgi:hypothetical protein
MSLAGRLRRPGLAGLSATVALAVAVRLGLLVLGWPETNSDEGTMGLMAIHIAQGRDHPAFFYGQGYMGSGEAWAAAGLFAAFGPSLLALRLALVAGYAGFVVAVWRLGDLLHGRWAAHASALVLAFGSAELLADELRASGSRVELLLAASLMAWLSAWLVLRGGGAPPWRQGAVAAGWGLAAGYGLWTDLLTVPWALVTGLLLAVCWRPSRPRSLLGLLAAGMLVGGLPQVLHNVGADWGRNDSVTVVLNQRGYQAGPAAPPLADRLAGAVTVALPYAAGGSALAHRETAGPWASSPGVARVVLGGCGAGLLALLALAAWRGLRDVGRGGRAALRGPPAAPVARLAVLAGVGLTLAVFATSPRAVYTPIASARYLVGVLVAVPVLAGALGPWLRGTRGRWLAAVAVAAVAGVLALDTAGVYRQALALRQSDAEQPALVAALLDRGVTRVWTDYWTCDRIAFESRERIACGSLDERLALHDNRYGPYLEAVRADADAPYLFRASSAQATALRRSRRPSAPLPDGYLIFR